MSTLDTKKVKFQAKEECLSNEFPHPLNKSKTLLGTTQQIPTTGNKAP